MTTKNESKHSTRFTRWMIAILACPIAYVLSSGPVLAIAFWLREATGWDGFYLVMFVYYPLFMMGHANPVGAYIEWWVELLGTVGPG